MQRILAPTMFLVLIAGGPALAIASAPPAPAGAPVLVVAGDADRVVRRAGGRSFGPAGTTVGTLASSPDADFPRRLRDSGAWLVLDGRVIAAICAANP